MAFDRHMNVVLCDVTEQCVPFRTVANGGVAEGRRRKKKNKKKELDVEMETERPSDHVTSSLSHVSLNAVTRHLKQVFIRGDNIIMICRVPCMTY